MDAADRVEECGAVDRVVAGSEPPDQAQRRCGFQDVLELDVVTVGAHALVDIHLRPAEIGDGVNVLVLVMVKLQRQRIVVGQGVRPFQLLELAVGLALVRRDVRVEHIVLAAGPVRMPQLNHERIVDIHLVVGAQVQHGDFAVVVAFVEAVVLAIGRADPVVHAPVAASVAHEAFRQSVAADVAFQRQSAVSRGAG